MLAAQALEGYQSAVSGATASDSGGCVYRGFGFECVVGEYPETDLNTALCINTALDG